jgi:hypothetical protein
MKSRERQTPQAVRFLLIEVYVFSTLKRVSSPAAFPSPSNNTMLSLLDIFVNQKPPKANLTAGKTKNQRIR